MALRILIPVLFLVFVTGVKSLEKPGSCPVVPAETRGTCAEECLSDDSCPGDEKCCSNGCGHTCRRPAKLTCPTLVCHENLDCTRNGYKLDEWGCAMCECYVDPCPKFKCRACPEYYNYRLIDGHLCQGCECVSSVDCPPLQCQCPHGYHPDTDICPACRCVPDEGICPKLTCDLACLESGYKLDENGCAMCECYADPCPLFGCEACPKYYNYGLMDGHICRGCECVSSIECPKLQCQCPTGNKPGTDINGCPTCICVPDDQQPNGGCIDVRKDGVLESLKEGRVYVYIILGSLVLLLIISGIIGFIIYRKKRNNRNIGSSDFKKETLNGNYHPVVSPEPLNSEKNPII